ncbi:uncharacterized protein [Anabrus simplex]|uniref:uncharacterized protein n=1 Tax=Anabrus simplex TaxID=316456 RepID=UPI0035A3040B
MLYEKVEWFYRAGEASGATAVKAVYVLVLSFIVARKLVMRELVVPRQVDIRDDVILSCRFDLGGERLYSVKWYKDEFEFYRYMPDNFPPCQSLPVRGVTLLNARCNMENVTLTKLTFNSSGMYRCEVSTEAPNFQTVYMNRNMTVIALPRREPMIEGVLSTYTIGDSVRALCTSDKSNPPSQLSWFINGVKAEYWILEQMPTADGKNAMTSLRADPWLQEHDYEALPPDVQGLYTRTLGLNFVTEKRFFIGEPPKMELRCTATVGNRTWSATVTPTLNALTNLGLAQERLGNHGYPVASSWGTLLVLLFSVYTS